MDTKISGEARGTNLLVPRIPRGTASQASEFCPPGIPNGTASDFFGCSIGPLAYLTVDRIALRRRASWLWPAQSRKGMGGQE
jgi:hypothetical protein